MRTFLFGLILILAPLASASRLDLGEGFYATHLNGKPVSVHADTLLLGEGKQVITLRYANPYIFHKEVHEVIVSGPRYLVFQADRAGPYRIVADLPTELNDAKAFAWDPRLQVKQGSKLIPHQLYSETQLQALFAQQLP